MMTVILQPGLTLEHARSDVEQLRDVLVNRGAFDRKHIRTLFDAEATREGLETICAGTTKPSTSKIEARINPRKIGL